MPPVHDPLHEMGADEPRPSKKENAKGLPSRPPSIRTRTRMDHALDPGAQRGEPSRGGSEAGSRAGKNRGPEKVATRGHGRGWGQGEGRTVAHRGASAEERA